MEFRRASRLHAQKAIFLVGIYYDRYVRREDYSGSA
jgi:hypothetical protein